MPPQYWSHGTQGLIWALALTGGGLAGGLTQARGGLASLGRGVAWWIPLTVAGALAGAVLRMLLPAGLAGAGLLVARLGQLALFPLAGYCAAWLLAARERGADSHHRGTIIRDGRHLQTEALRHGAPLCLAGVAVTVADETKHFKLIGTTGTGKSTAIAELLGGALKRGDRAVIADPDGRYRQLFFSAERGDAILNPYEPLAHRWDPFAEIHAPYDVDQLARSLIPDAGSAAAREWQGYARTFFTGVMRQLHAAGVHRCAELYRLLAVAPHEELRHLVGGTAAQPFLEPENARMFGSIRSVTVNAVAALEAVAEQQADALSVRDWVGHGRGVLFVPYSARQIAALGPIIAAWLRLAIFEAMNPREGAMPQYPRLWFVIDELDALGPIDGLKDALARLRKFEGRCVLGFQSIAQVSGTYGVQEAHTIVENCGNTLILRCSASEHGGTARFASQLIGQREVLRRHTSKTRSGGWGGRGQRSSTHSDQHVTEDAVLASEIEQLADLEGFLKLASSSQWLRLRLPRNS
jgi:type IV secretory pathway TraG/TraD family ATPase VirD4